MRSRTAILEHVWDAHWYGPTKTVDAHVAAVRKKLGDHRWIEAVRGVGFRFEEPPREVAHRRRPRRAWSASCWPPTTSRSPPTCAGSSGIG